MPEPLPVHGAIHETVVLVPPDFNESYTVTVAYRLNDGRIVDIVSLRDIMLQEGWQVVTKAEWQAKFSAELKAAYGMSPHDVLGIMGEGAALCIALDGDSAKCVNRWKKEETYIPVQLARWTLAFFGYMLCRAEREDNPPAPHKHHSAWKAGWESSGFPGATHEIWRFIQ